MTTPSLPSLPPSGDTNWYTHYSALHSTTFSGAWLPSSYGWLTWAYDPVFLSTSTTLTAGTILGAKLFLPYGGTVSNIVLNLATAGSGLTSGQNFCGLWSATGTFIAQTTDQTTPFASAGLKACALSSPTTVSAGAYWIGIWSRGTTPPAISRATGTSANNGFLGSGLPGRFGSDATSSPTTTAPAPVAFTATNNSYWFALS